MNQKQRLVIGAIYPEDADIDDDLCQFLPTHAELRSARTPIDVLVDATVDLIQAMVESTEIEDAAKSLAKYNPACIVYACTSGSFVRGVGRDLDLIQRITATASVMATTTSTAMVRALRELGIQRVAVGAPYLQEVTDKLGVFLKDSGFEVTHLHSLNIGRGPDIHSQPYEVIRDLARQADTPEADAIFLSCTGLRTAPVIDDLEQELDKPVLTANQVTMWDALRLLEISLPPHRGQLFRSYDEVEGA